MRIRTNHREILHLTRCCLLALTCISIAPAPILGWGSMAHGLATNTAIDRTPGPLGGLFRANRDFMRCYSVLPDSWKGSPELLPGLPGGLENPVGLIGPAELPHHFIAVDADLYARRASIAGGPALPVMTRQEALSLWAKFAIEGGPSALAELQKETPSFRGGIEGLPQAMFERSGQIPWAVLERLDDLVAAMRARDWRGTIFLSTILGHYVSDMHVPLHTAVNYNGQYGTNPLTKGIHARWESRLVERYEQGFVDFLNEKTKSQRARERIDTRPLTVASQVFRTINESHSLVSGILRDDDRILTRLYPRPVTVDRSKVPEDDTIYNNAYYTAFRARQGRLAMDRLSETASGIALFWRIAWERAQRPIPPADFVLETPLIRIDWRHGRLVPYDPKTGPVE